MNSMESCLHSMLFFYCVNEAFPRKEGEDEEQGGPRGIIATGIFILRRRA